MVLIEFLRIDYSIEHESRNLIVQFLKNYQKYDRGAIMLNGLALE